MIAPPRVLPFSWAICGPAPRAPSRRGLNGLYPASHDCYHDDENDENAKRDQFSYNHTRLQDADLRLNNQTGRLPQQTGLVNQATGGARGASGSVGSAFRNGFGCSSEMVRGGASTTPNQRRPSR